MGLGSPAKMRGETITKASKASNGGSERECRDGRFSD